MKWLLYGHNYLVAEQFDTMPFINDVISGRYDRIVNHCKLAEAFQDAPYSYSDEGMLAALTTAYPNAKFILTVRETPEIWWNSYQKWYFNLWKLPNKELTTWPELEGVPHQPWFNKTHLPSILQQIVIPDKDVLPFDKNRNVEHYLNYNYRVESFFKSRPQYDFLKVCLSDNDTQDRLTKFLGFKVNYLPHANRNKPSL